MQSLPSLSTREKIIAAAIRIFGKQGVQQTTMGDIADEAELSRQTVYRLFSSRTALLEAILIHRFIDVLEGTRPIHERSTSLDEALVEAPFFAMNALRNDALFIDIVNNAADRGVEDMVLIANAEIRKLHMALWMQSFAKARKSGMLRSPLSDERLTEGIRSIAAYLVLRSDLREHEQRAFLRDFLVPAILGVVASPAKKGGGKTLDAPQPMPYDDDDNHSASALSSERVNLQVELARMTDTLSDEKLTKLIEIAAIVGR